MIEASASRARFAAALAYLVDRDLTHRHLIEGAARRAGISVAEALREVDAMIEAQDAREPIEAHDGHEVAVSISMIKTIEGV